MKQASVSRDERAIARSFYSRKKIYPLLREMPFQDPFQVYQNLYRAEQPSIFLDSARQQPLTASFSYIGINPVSRITLRLGEKPFAKIREILAAYSHVQPRPGLPHFWGGAAGYLSYDLFRVLDKTRTRIKTLPREPAVDLLLIRDVIAFDHVSKRAWLITSLLPGVDGSFSSAWENAQARLRAMEQQMTGSGPRSNRSAKKSPLSGFSANCTRLDFEKNVRAAKRYIRAGDIYQVNLSQRFSFNLREHPLRVYEKLRQVNAAPFCAFLNMGKMKVLSSSPERLVRLQGRQCETRPIAGTITAGKNEREREIYARRLIRDPKERAEHLMLVDLERNDLGKVCDFYSVKVDEMMSLEKYSRVTHIVSNVRGRLRRGKDGFALMEAVFPGGTITGCPKIRSMEIIDELEPGPRGIYTGAIGYFGFNGDMDWNIVIRSLVLQGRQGQLQVGAGIVHDSKPAREYRETLHKAEALLQALGLENDEKE